jgi:hypothetical protein
MRVCSLLGHKYSISLFFSSPGCWWIQTWSLARSFGAQSDLDGYRTELNEGVCNERTTK